MNRWGVWETGMTETDRRVRTPADQAGFSTLEAIVALAILATAMLPLLTLQSQLTNAATRMEHQADLVEARAVAIAYLSLVDPVEQTAGDIQIGGGWVLDWQAVPIEDARRARFGNGLSSRYMVQPIQVGAVLQHASGRTAMLDTITLGIDEQLPFSQGLSE